MEQVNPSGVGFAAYGATSFDYTAAYGPYKPNTGYLTEQMLQVIFLASLTLNIF